jgi:hypothetical protein
MKSFDIKADINNETYEDEFTLCISEKRKKQYFELTVNELLDLYEEVKHTVETNIC